jgi:hypothetical protein
MLMDEGVCRELKAASGYQSLLSKKQAQASELGRCTVDDSVAKEEAAVAAGRKALARLEDAKSKVKAARADLDSQAEDKWAKQAEALVLLKASLDAIHVDIRSKVGAYRCTD